MREILLVVDMQNDFVTGTLGSPAAQQIVPCVVEVVKDYLDQGKEVFFTLDTHEPGDPEFSKWPEHCLNGSWGQRLVSELEQLAASRPALVRRVEKKSYSAFFGTSLEAELGLVTGTAKPRTARACVVGVATNICVFFSVADLAKYGVEITVPAAGVASFDVKAHEYSLQQMAQVLGVKIC